MQKKELFSNKYNHVCLILLSDNGINLYSRIELFIKKEVWFDNLWIMKYIWVLKWMHFFDVPLIQNMSQTEGIQALQLYRLCNRVGVLGCEGPEDLIKE